MLFVSSQWNAVEDSLANYTKETEWPWFNAVNLNFIRGRVNLSDIGPALGIQNDSATVSRSTDQK